ncbi:erythromycin esterase family protein [Streptomyces sp. NPDC060209]|uniref:erythromycin esterase family protein n=1 Tax=Streptomyces sp. NPDC060209 TaxID=3347073 RepID=UPI003664BD30
MPVLHRTHRLPRLLLILLVLMLEAGTLSVAARPVHANEVPTTDPVRELARVAEPLRSTVPGAPDGDLRPLGRMIGSAKIVGLGEATHGSRQFFTMKQRVFRYLVEEKGFTTFALEAPWSTGLVLNEYVLYGKGDPAKIMRKEFQSSYRIWNTGEYLDLLRWMRAHNVRHPDHPVQFMGEDNGYAGPELFDEVTHYVSAHHPKLLPEFRRLYRELRPMGSVEETVNGNLAKPVAERKRTAAMVRRAYELLQAQGPHGDGQAYEWALQHARAISQTGTLYAYYDFDDPEKIAQAMLYRDQVMAENTVWWQRHTGHRMLLSAHNGHVSYESDNPEQYPKTQGEFIRQTAGAEYMNIGYTFGQGAFNAMDLTDPEEPYRRFSVEPLGAGSNEAVLERVSGRDYYLDLRAVPESAQDWLMAKRPTRSIGNSWPEALYETSLGRQFDVLIHLHRVTAADLLPTARERKPRGCASGVTGAGHPSVRCPRQG